MLGKWSLDKGAKRERPYRTLISTGTDGRDLVSDVGRRVSGWRMACSLDRLGLEIRGQCNLDIG
jgi:hypothetical protein